MPQVLSKQEYETYAKRASANGTIFTTTTGGTAPYTYAWSNNKNTKNINLLAANTYHLTTTEAGGCTITTRLSSLNPTPS